jgi:hypothetical protein
MSSPFEPDVSTTVTRALALRVQELERTCTTLLENAAQYRQDRDAAEVDAQAARESLDRYVFTNKQEACRVDSVLLQVRQLCVEAVKVGTGPMRRRARGDADGLRDRALKVQALLQGLKKGGAS